LFGRSPTVAVYKSDDETGDANRPAYDLEAVDASASAA